MAESLNKKQLYDLVWARPMVEVAKEYGLSNRGLAKLAASGHAPITLPTFDMDALNTVLMGMLSLGGLRTYEKAKGVA